MDEKFLKEKELKRLTDSLGKEEPMKGILTDDEILKYAENSKEASRIRLKRGIGGFKDKIKVHDEIGILWIFFPFSIGFWFCLSLFYNFLIGEILFSVITVFFLIYIFFYFHVKNYFDSTYKLDVQNKEKKNLNENKEMGSSKNDDLLLLFESKEKIAREMIEKRFPSPQITNTKFNAVLDNCKGVVESQIESLNALTLTEKTAYEIESRKKLIKQVISKIDDLTNELILSEQTNIESVIDEMDDLIYSIKEYK